MPFEILRAATLFGTTLTFAATLTSPLGASHPVIIKMGDGTIDGSFLHPYDNLFRYTVTTPEGKRLVQGLWSDHLQVTTIANQTALLRVQGLTYVNGKTTSTVNVFDARTLRPISSRRQDLDGSVQVRTFDGTHVSVQQSTPSGSQSQSSFEVPVLPYDFNGGMYGLILVALPLKIGLSGSFPAVEEREGRYSIEAFEVLGQEDIDGGSLGRIHSWKAEVRRPGQYTMTFWLLKSEPYIIKLEFKADHSPEIWDWTKV